jgi:hypothetical protein
LGYDAGHDELWELIGEKFGSPAGMSCTDTLSDAGGRFYNNPFETNHVFTINSHFNGPINLNFIQLALKGSTFSLFDGPDTLAPLLAIINTDEVPQTFQATGESLTLKLKLGPSDLPAYSLVWRCPSAGITQQKQIETLKVSPNPAHNIVQLEIPNQPETINYHLYNSLGTLVAKGKVSITGQIDLQKHPGLSEGVYIIRVITPKAEYSAKFLHIN